MSHKARYLDNACIESFFNKLKVEINDLKKYPSSQELIEDIKTWIDYYNNDRVQVRLNGFSPIDYKRAETH
jgi:putative transposase